MNRDSYLWDGTGEPDEDVERLESLLGGYRSTSDLPDESYLWDGSGEVDPAVATLESQLREFRSTAAVPDIPFPGPVAPIVVPFRSRPFVVRLLPFAAAAAIAAVAIGGTGIWVASQEPETRQANGPVEPNPVPGPDVIPVPDTKNEPATTDERPVDGENAPAPRSRIARTHQVAKGAPPAKVAPSVLPVPDRAPLTAVRRVSYAVDTTTALHLEQAQILLRSFRNTAPDDAEGLAYETRRSRELLTRNVVLRRAAVNQRNVPAYSVLSDIEPFLLDIANLDARAQRRDVREIQDRVERSAIVADVQLYARSGPVAGY